MNLAAGENVTSKPPRRRRGLLGWLAIGGLLTVIVLAAVGEIMMRRALPILKGRVV